MITAMQANKYMTKSWSWRIKYTNELNYIESQIFQAIADGRNSLLIEWFDDHGFDIGLKVNGKVFMIGSLLELVCYMESYKYKVEKYGNFIKIGW